MIADPDDAVAPHVVRFVPAAARTACFAMTAFAGRVAEAIASQLASAANASTTAGIAASGIES